MASAKSGGATPRSDGDEAVWSRCLEGRGSCFLLCDHASNFIPPRYNRLGLDPSDVDKHFVWDPGAWELATRLSSHGDMPLIGAGVSRLLVDCNRNVDDPDLIVSMGETTPIPGNAEISPDEKAARLQAFYTPFHTAISTALANRTKTESLVSIHTFTPVFKGVFRPWHVGVLFDHDDRLGKLLLQQFSSDKSLVVGENQPYSPKDRVFRTLDRHGQAHGKPTAMIEIRNDLVSKEAGLREWSERIADALATSVASLGPMTPA